MSATAQPTEYLAINIQPQEKPQQEQEQVASSAAVFPESITRKPCTPPSSHAQVPFLLLITSFCMWSTATILDSHLFTVYDNSASAVTSHLWGFVNLVQQAIFVPVMYVILTSARRKAPPAPIVWAFLLGIVSNTQSSTIVSILSQFPLRLTSTIADGSRVAAVVDTQAVSNSYHFAYAAYGGYAAMVGCHLFCHMRTVSSAGFTSVSQKIAFAVAIALHSFTIAIVITAPGDSDAALVSLLLVVFVALLIKEAYSTGSKSLFPIGSRPVVQFYLFSYLAALSTVGLAAAYVYGGRAMGYHVVSVQTPSYSLTM